MGLFHYIPWFLNASSWRDSMNWKGRYTHFIANYISLFIYRLIDWLTDVLKIWITFIVMEIFNFWVWEKFFQPTHIFKEFRKFNSISDYLTNYIIIYDITRNIFHLSLNYLHYLQINVNVTNVRLTITLINYKVTRNN